MPPAALSDAELLALTTDVTRLVQRGEPFALVIDVRGSPPVTANQRRIIAEAMDRNAEAYPQSNPFTAVVLENSLQRGILKALQWLTRTQQKLEPFSSREEAVGWAERKLGRAP